jgi:hypothetical protein
LLYAFHFYGNIELLKDIKKGCENAIGFTLSFRPVIDSFSKYLQLQDKRVEIHIGPILECGELEFLF